MSSKPRDALFKHTFSQPQHAIELLRSVLPPAVVRHIDFDTLQVEPTSFIDEKLRARFLPEPVLARIRRAEFALLDSWLDRGIMAQSLGDVFADEP
jgi:Putative transposase, YhgA-like